MYDLVLRGGIVVDPSTGLDGVNDIAVHGGVIAAIAPEIGDAEAARTIDVAGKVVTPGLIDLHAHVFDGVSRNGVHPDLAGVYAGVTTIVDAGSAGAATFAAFPRHIIPNCSTEVVPFLHIGQTGLATNPDIIAASSIDLDDTLRVFADEQLVATHRLQHVQDGWVTVAEHHRTLWQAVEPVEQRSLRVYEEVASWS